MNKIAICKQELLSIFQWQRKYPGSKHILADLCEMLLTAWRPYGHPRQKAWSQGGMELPLCWKHSGFPEPRGQ